MKTRIQMSIVLMLIVALLASVPNVNATAYMDGTNWTGIDSIKNTSGNRYLINSSYLWNLFTTTYNASGMSNPATANLNMNGYNVTNVTNVSAKQIGGVIYADQYPTIQDAINNVSSLGGIVKISGTISNSGDIIGKSFLTLKGDGRESSTLRISGTLNFSDSNSWTIEGLKIDCMGTNVCIKAGMTSGVVHSNWATMQNVFVYNYTTGLDTGSSNPPGSLIDSTFYNTHFGTGQIGVDIYGTEIKFNGGTFGTNTIAGIKSSAAGASGIVAGNIFSGNGVSLLYTVAGAGQWRFFGTWHEDKQVINSTYSSVTAVTNPSFYGAHLAGGLDRPYLFDLTNITTTVNIFGGRLDITGQVDNSISSGSVINTYNLEGENTLTQTGTGLLNKFDTSYLNFTTLQKIDISQRINGGREQFWRMTDNGLQTWGILKYGSDDDRAFIFCTVNTGLSDCSNVVGNLTQNGNFNIAGKLRIGGMNTGIVNHGSSASAPTAFGAGDNYYNLTANIQQLYTGSVWDWLLMPSKVIAGSGIFVSNPNNGSVVISSSDILNTTMSLSPVTGQTFWNTTSKTQDCYDGVWRYCGNGTAK